MLAWISASHGARSASVNGTPRLIFSTLARECRVSPSRNAHGIAAASKWPTVVFPDPATPITTTSTDILSLCRQAPFCPCGVRDAAFIIRRRQRAHGGNHYERTAIGCPGLPLHPALDRREQHVRSGTVGQA